MTTGQQIGGALGVAVLTTLAARRTESLGAAGHGRDAALTGGFQLAFGIGAALVAAAAVVTLAVLRPRTPGGSRKPDGDGAPGGGAEGADAAVAGADTGGAAAPAATPAARPRPVADRTRMRRPAPATTPR